MIHKNDYCPYYKKSEGDVIETIMFYRRDLDEIIEKNKFINRTMGKPVVQICYKCLNEPEELWGVRHINP